MIPQGVRWGITCLDEEYAPGTGTEISRHIVAEVGLLSAFSAGLGIRLKCS
jgi:hypothetical protein